MRAFWVIVKKEIKDNWRDRRSIFFALLYGPLLLPLLLVGTLAGGVKKHSIDFDELLTIQTTQSIPALEHYLLEQNVRVVSADEAWQEQLSQGLIRLVLEPVANYSSLLASARSASLTLHFNSEDDASVKARQRVMTAVQQYSQHLASMRLKVRGIDGQLIRPLQPVDADIAPTGGAEKVVARILPFILLLALTMGGFYLAVDTSAGERERHSLEPLLALAIRRRTLVLAKWAALSFFVALSGVLVVVTCFVLLTFLPLKELEQLIHTDALSFFYMFLVIMPLVAFFSSAMLLITSLTRNSKEAQTHLGFAMMVPMAPFFLVQFLNIKNSILLSAVPVISQFLIIESIMVGEPLGLLMVVCSVVGSLCTTLVFLLITVALYHSEKMLSGES